MTAAHDHEELYHLVGRLSPSQAQRLLALVKADPELAEAADDDVYAPRVRVGRRLAGPGQSGDALERFQAFVGIIDSGRSDLSERHEEIIREGFNSLT